MTIIAIMWVILASGTAATSQMPLADCVRVSTAFAAGALVEIETDDGQEIVVSITCVPQRPEGRGISDAK